MSTETFSELVRTRRSVRQFEDKEIPTEVLAAILEGKYCKYVKYT